MKWYWKVVIVSFSVLLLAVVVDLGVNLWAKSRLSKIINRKNDSVYFITYKKVNISLWSGSIKVDEIVLVPKASLSDTLKKAGVYAKVKSVEVTHFKVLNLLFNNKLKARSVRVEQPKVVFYKTDKSENIRNSVVEPFNKTITVPDVYVNHADLKVVDVKTNKAVLSLSNLNLNVDGILINDAILEEKIPFKYNNYLLSCDSLYYHPNEFYQIKTQKITTTRTDFKIEKFKMLPTYSRREFVARIPKERDLNTLLCDSIKLTKVDWGFNKDDLFVHCSVIALDHAAANIYRSKSPPDDLTKKYLYNKLLRDIKFDLKIDTLKVRHSILEYEEEKLGKLGPGKLRFTNFNLTATSISSGFKKTTLPDLKIKINCRLMGASPLNVNWRLNVMDKSDGFRINGTLTNFEAEKIIPFSKPYLNITTKGIIDQVRFNFVGNDKGCAGEFKVEYDDLKFTIYKKDKPKKKNKLLTFIAKIFVKKDTKDKLKEAHIAVARIPEKSFYNFLWRSIEEGLKKILI